MCLEDTGKKSGAQFLKSLKCSVIRKNKPCIKVTIIHVESVIFSRSCAGIQVCV